MNHTQKLLNIIRIALLCAFLIIFMLLSLNSVLPLKWRFPSWRLSPHLTARSENTETGTRIDYVNSRGVLTVALDKNYATIIKTLDQDGNCVLEQYFDSHGRPAVMAAGHSALRREYNREGKWVCTTYLDDKLNPVVTTNGYASVHRTYNSIGEIDTVTYYDADGLPAVNYYQEYGIHYDYDSDKRLSAVTNLDAAGNSMNNKNRYAVKKYTYDSDGELYMTLYYDADGNPAKLSNGEYGYIYENGKPICIDRNGGKIFSLRYFLLHSIVAVMVIGVLLLLLIMLSGRAVTWILLPLYLAFIAYMTIMDREAGISIITWDLPPNIYRFFMTGEVLANIWLFVPLGAILYKLSHMWEIVALPIALSLIIEISQLVFDIGAFQVSDLAANSLGGIVGIIVCYLLETLFKARNSSLNSKIRTRQ